ncbi:MAG: NAD(P)-dependent oxidoreductase [Thiotrichaceae bacterium]|nr:NAD(P)-dependent oxidoreductase [Thiotrichaceae bacterium]
MKKVIVTGATGFIGQHTLLPLKERGFDVHAITSQRCTPKSDLYTWHSVDLFTPQAIENLFKKLQPTHLLHLAWYTEHGKFWTASENFSWIQASIELYKQFHLAGGQRVVSTGSCVEYDWSYGYCSETVTPTNPKNPYGICKLALSQLTESYCQLHNISHAWARIFFLYGEQEPPTRLVSSVIRALLSQQVAKCSQGEQIRDFLHVQDVANALVTLLDSDLTGTINIGSGQPTTIKTIVTMIADKIGVQELLALGTLPLQPNESPLILADVTRLKNELHWQPEYDLNSGLERTINWWSQHLEINN